MCPYREFMTAVFEFQSFVVITNSSKKTFRGGLFNYELESVFEITNKMM